MAGPSEADQSLKPLRDLLLEAREAQGMSRQELAEHLHTDIGTIGRWERGDAIPRRRSVTGLALFLRIPADTLEYAIKVANQAEKANRAEPYGGDGRTISVSRDDAFYARGVLDTTIRMLGHAMQSLEAVRGILTSATDGMAEVAALNVLPPRRPPDNNRPRISPDELRGQDEDNDRDEGAA